jgi:arylformamidase
MSLYRGMDKAALDAAYNNSAAIGGAEARDRFIADVTARTKALDSRAKPQRDLAYGPGARQRLDFYASGTTGAPTLIFIHGGYWRSTDKENWGYVAAGPLAHGINVANVEYTLAPANRIDGIVAEVKRAVGWVRANLARLGGDPEKLYVSGHSAGGHLTAMVAGEPGIRGALPISGVFDMMPMRLSSMNADFRLDEAEERRTSPQQHIPASAPPMIVAVGGGELPEFLRQSRDYAAARAAKGLKGRLLEVGAHNHFSVLDDLADPDGELALAARNLIEGRGWD